MYWEHLDTDASKLEDVIFKHTVITDLLMDWPWPASSRVAFATKNTNSPTLQLVVENIWSDQLEL